MSYLDEDVKITIFWKDKGNLIANANVSLETVVFGYLTIKGFQIWKSNILNSRLQEHINITPPSVPVYGRYISTAFLEDMEKWSDLEMRIYSKFLEARRKIQEKTEINLDEIVKEIQ